MKRELPKPRQERARRLVVFSYLGGDKHLAAAFEGRDVIVGGPSHNRMEHTERVGQTLIVQAGAYRPFRCVEVIKRQHDGFGDFRP